MKRSNTLGGVGGIAFGVLTFVGLLLASPVGGNYKASEATGYIASGHRPAVFVALYLVLLGVLGLICLLARLRETVIAAAREQDVALSIFWGTGIAAATSFAIGWCVTFAAPLAHAYSGGGGFSIGPAQTYLISQVGGIIIYGAAGILLGLALITLALAARATLPAWVRWLTLIAGVIGLASPAFFPWFFLLIWGLVIGIWLLASGRDAASSPMTAPASTPLP